MGLLILPSAILYAGTYRPKDGLLSFLLLLGFLLAILGLLHLIEFIKARLKGFLEGILDGL